MQMQMHMQRTMQQMPLSGRLGMSEVLFICRASALCF